jgi:hypothetical protein
VVDERTVKAHRVVLSANSVLFRRIFGTEGSQGVAEPAAKGKQALQNTTAPAKSKGVKGGKKKATNKKNKKAAKKKATDADDGAEKKDDVEVPEHFLCPITQEIMVRLFTHVYTVPRLGSHLVRRKCRRTRC